MTGIYHLLKQISVLWLKLIGKAYLAKKRAWTIVGLHTASYTSLHELW